MFPVGMKVVCVRVPRGGYGTEERPVVKRTYTVRGARQFGNDGIGIILEEIKNDARLYSTGYHEAHFIVTCFRPLIERKTDIGFAYEILRKASKKKRSPTTAEIMKAFDNAIDAIKRA